MTSLSKLIAATITAFLPVSVFAQFQPPPQDVVPSDSVGNTAMGGSVLQNIQNSQGNTGAGDGALQADTTGYYNTSVGFGSLTRNTTGYQNTASGVVALWNNITGNNNIATGFEALYGNTSGSYNTASGHYVMSASGTGWSNTATGGFALNANGSGNENTASGFLSLSCSHNANYNTASGAYALSGGSFDFSQIFPICSYTGTGGSANTADGFQALNANTSGEYGTASGYQALHSNTTGNQNTAFGAGALSSNITGGNNIALGFYAGANIVEGYRNIDIGNSGVASDAGIIRIGTSTEQSAAYIAGIAGSKVTGSAVYVTSTGQLGVLASSERYKTGIAPMGPSTDKLRQLRPVTFRLKSDPDSTIQYGLIAEEVAKVYPELVVRDEKGKIQGVRYEELAPMLLNEAQQQRQEIGQLKRQLRQLQAALANLQSEGKLVAQR